MEVVLLQKATACASSSSGLWNVSCVLFEIDFVQTEKQILSSNSRKKIETSNLTETLR